VIDSGAVAVNSSITVNFIGVEHLVNTSIPVNPQEGRNSSIRQSRSIHSR